MIFRANKNDGFTLIELIVVILILGVLASIATLKMGESLETARVEQTKTELDNLAWAIVGNPELYSGGTRTDFGFVGDNGILPSTLNDLVQNPGGWATWDGPYIATGLAADDFKRDGWGVGYTLLATAIRSTGSGSNIDKPLAASQTVLLANSVSGWVVDADRQVPPPGFEDSVTVLLSFPDGAGNLSSATTSLDTHGRFSYGSVPIGNHTLMVIYEPDSDTMTYAVSVSPNRDVSLDIIFPADLW